MSLSVARSIAYSSLMATQVQMSVASANVANADTDGYTAKSANQSARVLGGAGSGVSITSITSSVDKLLLRSIIEAAAELGAADTAAEYTDRIQALFGSVEGDDETGTSIANSIAALETALLELAGTPESESLQSVVVDALDTLAGQLRDTSASIQNLRADADDEIEAKVQEVNDSLKTIDDLNDAISRASALGQSTADLEDKRNTTLESISSLMDVTYFVASTGRMQIYTTDGQALLDTTVHELSYESTAKVTSSTTYSATPPSGFDAISVDGKDITEQIKSGTIGALIDQRDETLPAAQAELDELATELADALNTVHNQGTAMPPPNSLTGTTAVSATDAFSGSGSMRVAVTDQDGKLVSYQDIDLSACSTVGDVVDAIDAVDGLSATITADGHVQITADDADQGVAINEMDSAVGTAGQGVSDWLGLNDLVTATGASDFRVRADILSDNSLLATATLDDSTTLTTGDAVLAIGSTGTADGLYGTLTGSNTFDAAGRLSEATSSFSSYAADIVSANASAASHAETKLSGKETAYNALSEAMSSQTGVNLDEETARVSELETLYEATATLMQVINDMFNSLIDMVEAA
jgi:flagellar hook-associated protein 1 FlgK